MKENFNKRLFFLFFNKVSIMERRWYLWFIAFGMFGTFFEICIGGSFSLFLFWLYPDGWLYIYYNEFWTSLESFFLFGIFGCFGLRLVLTKYDLIRKEKMA